MKSKILINPGVGWTGTTPFYYTLRNAGFCHAGYEKEFHYLDMMNLNNPEFDDYMLERYTDVDAIDFRTDKPRAITKEWDKDYYTGLMTAPHSFDKYAHHMMHLHESYPEYHAACDFSNHNIALPQEFLTAHAKAMHEYFDVKITILIAEPIWRYYQELGGVINQCIARKGFTAKKRKILYKNPDLITNHYIRTKQQHKLFKYCVERSRFSKNCNYKENIEKFIMSYGKKNVLVLEMEKIWDSSYHNETFDRLSEFLDYEVLPKHLHPNQYMSDDKNIYGLRDQDTEYEPFTEEIKEFGRQYMNKIRFYNYNRV